MRQKTKKKPIFAITAIILILILAILIGIIISKLQIWKNNNGTIILPNTEINGINISNMTKADAIEKVSAYIKDKTNNFSLTLKYGDKIHIIDKDDYTINPDIATIVEVSNKQSDDIDILSSLNYFTSHGNSTEVSFSYIFQGIDAKINSICESIETQPIDSTISFDPNRDEMFEITKSEKGTKVNRTKLYENINKQFQLTNQILVELELEEALPELTEEDNMELTSLVSKFSTKVSDSTGGRKHNVNLALSKFNGLIINPGESISFNDITSPHTLDNGYKIATIILNSRFVDGVGGGICQASTTIYNALLQAGATINEVHKHTLPVKYVPLALDAMVSEGIADLKITNNTASPMYIKTTNTSDDVTVEVYSRANPNGLTFTTRSETIKTLPALEDKIVPDVNKEHSDKVIFKGEKHRLTYARDGYEVNSYIQTWQDGKMIDERLHRHEIYQPQAGIIIEGTEEPIQDMPIIEDITDIPDPLDMDNNFLFSTSKLPN